MSTKNLLIKFGLALTGGKMLRDLKKASKDCYKAQHNKLTDIVKYARNTVYGKEHDFEKISTIQDFQNNVPINDYEDLKPYILRHAKGEDNVLFPEKPIIYATTSGTTREAKLIPITPKYYKECYNALSKLWLYTIIKETPEMADGKDITVVGKALEGYTEDGTPIGSISGHLYKNLPKMVQKFHSIPPAIAEIGDYQTKYYVVSRIGIENDITFFVTPNPSTIIELNNVINNNIDEFIEQIENGTLKKSLDLPDGIRKEIEKGFKPNPKRADELRKLKEKHGTIFPKHYWPNLAVVVVWKCGNSGMYLNKTKNWFPDQTVIREFGYMATETRTGIILKNDQIPSILAYHLSFFEFIKKDDWGKETPKVYLASELEEGEYYYLIVTTQSGLYRYNMNDIVRVDGYYNDFPMVTFIQKGVGVTSLTGEKLYEQQLIGAIKDTEKQTGMKTQFYIAFADFDTSSYHLFVEFEKDHPSDDELKTFCNKADNILREINPEYEAKRDSNRVKHIKLNVLPQNAFQKYKALCLEKGYKDGQFKLVHLLEDKKRMEIFKELSVKKDIMCG
jgi:hypothetical protein